MKPCLPTSLGLYEEIIKRCLCETDAPNSLDMFSGVQGGGDMETDSTSISNSREISSGKVKKGCGGQRQSQFTEEHEYLYLRRL